MKITEQSRRIKKRWIATPDGRVITIFPKKEPATPVADKQNISQAKEREVSQS